MMDIPKIISYGQRSIETLLALLLIFLPIYHATAPREIFFFLPLFIFIVIKVLAFKHTTRLDLQKTCLELWFIISFFWILILLPFSLFPKDLSGQIHILGKVAKPYILYFLAVNIIWMNDNRDKKVKKLLIPFGLLSFIMAIYAIYQFTGNPVVLINRISAFCGHSQYYAIFLVLVIPIIAALAWSTDKWNRTFWIFTLLISLIGLFLTFKRAGWVAVFMEAILFILILKPRWQKIFWWGMALLCGLTLTLVAISHPKVLSHQLIMHSAASQTERIKAVGLTWNIVKRRPVTGIGWGLGSFHRYYPKQRIQHTHNLFLNTVVEIGIPGLLLLVLIFTILFSKLYRALKREGDLERKTLLAGIFISTTGFVIANLFDYMYHGWPVMAFWLLAGLGMGLTVHSSPPLYKQRYFLQKLPDDSAG